MTEAVTVTLMITASMDSPPEIPFKVARVPITRVGASEVRVVVIQEAMENVPVTHHHLTKRVGWTRVQGTLTALMDAS